MRRWRIVGSGTVPPRERFWDHPTEDGKRFSSREAHFRVACMPLPWRSTPNVPGNEKPRHEKFSRRAWVPITGSPFFAS